MTRDELTELHFITVADNVPSILEHGILSHNRVSRIGHVSIAMQEIQDRRRIRRIPGGRALHDYANLYFNARNKMMFKLKATRGVADVTVLRVSTDVLDVSGVVITDRNASSDHARFASSPSGLSMIERNIVFAEYWTHPGNTIAEMDHGSRVCAEVLVPEGVAATHIIGAYAQDDVAREKILGVAGGLEVIVKREMFFR